MTLKTKNNQHLWSQFETHEARLQVVMLGASNLSRSFPWAIDVAQQALARPLTIHAAMGFGRSYGKETGFFGKKFSGIFFSRLWEEWQRVGEPSTLAFVTDIGNDLAYEQPVDAIMEWVEGCVMRLCQRRAKVVITDLPIDALSRLSRAKFYAFRSLLFPKSRLSWTESVGRAEELSGRLRTLANTQKIPIFSVPNAWYGLDPIHPRWRCMREYWRQLFSMAAMSSAEDLTGKNSRVSRWRLRLLSSPGIGQKPRSGPFLSSRAFLSDGTSISLY